ncbi:hypothetical protein [Virgibacillus indicus]|uniref:hypothetical protein n=1 Tax=Virgibacillus indicus TaxID=2024554 RepID=UPI001F0A53E5|nr:hypothetical protein [Virgibacillus indicus]
MSKKIRIVLLSVLTISLIFLVIPWLRFLVFIVFPDNFFAQKNINISPKTLGYLITLLTVLIAYLLSRGKPKKGKYKLWGIAIMLLISLPLAYSIGITYAEIAGNPWAALMTFYAFPIIFSIGLIMLLIGVFKKDEAIKTCAV